MKEEFYKWNSQYFEHEFEMLVYGHGGYPVIIFPTLNGKYYEAKDNCIIESASDLIETGKIKIYCPETIDYLTWNNFSISPEDRAKSYSGYENVVLFDIIDFAKHETGSERVTLAGFDFGAYHALNISLKHPDKVGHLICIDGSFDIKKFIDNYYDDNCYFNNPPDYLPGLNDDWYLEKIKTMKIILGIGELDDSFGQNKRISGILNSKNINHQFDIYPNAGHDWELWGEIFANYLNEIFR